MSTSFTGKIISHILILCLFVQPWIRAIQPVYGQESTASGTVAITAQPPSTAPSAPPTGSSTLQPETSRSVSPSLSPTPVTDDAVPAASVSATPVTTTVTPPSLVPSTFLQRSPADPSPGSASIRRKMKLLPLQKRILQAKEQVQVKLLYAYDEQLILSVRNTSGEELPVKIEKETNGDETTYTLRPPAHFTPGRYRFQIVDSSGMTQEQDFTWGVLAINTDKSVYRPAETVRLALAVLDETGNMVCNAHTGIDIISPSGVKTTLGTWDRTIRVNPDCEIHDYTPRPDYEADFPIGSETGKYSMKVTAETKNGVWTIEDGFDVRDSPPYVISRSSATRIVPTKLYEMAISVTAQEDFTGIIEEVVPGDFILSPPADNSLKSYDTIASVSAGISRLGVSPGSPAPSDISLIRPYSGTFAQTLGFGDIPDNPQLQRHYQKFGLPAHDGVDIAMPEGTEILAADDGEVIFANDGLYGITVILRHTWGTSYYGHLSQTISEVNQKVKKGDIIALSGSTGFTTGPHLHFAIRPESTDKTDPFFGKVDPLLYIDRARTPVADQTVQRISWKVSLKPGDTVRLGYRYDAPNISPQFYLLGPARLVRSDGSLSLQITEEPVSTSSGEVTGTISPSPTAHASPSPTPTIATIETVYRESRQWQIAADADVVLDNNIVSASTEQNADKPKMVFVSDQVGYFFYVDSSQCSYAKTIDGGATWSNGTAVETTIGCVSIVVWYDQWTPSHFGPYIHMIMTDSVNDEPAYNNLDTRNDILIGEQFIFDPGAAINQDDSLFLSKSASNVLFTGITGGNAFTKQCDDTASDCTQVASWTNAGTSPITTANDHIRVLPIGTNNMVMIRNKIATNLIDYVTWDGSSWSTSTNIDTSVVDSTTYTENIAASVRRWNNTVYLAYVAGVAGNADLRTALGTWNGSSISFATTAEVLSNTTTVVNTDIAVDEESGEVYVVYTRGATAGSNTNVFYKSSTNNMGGWGGETQLNTSNANNNLWDVWMNVVDSDRIYFVYRDHADNDLLGNTVVNLAPPVLDEVMKHGDWWSRVGRRKYFSF